MGVGRGQGRGGVEQAPAIAVPARGWEARAEVAGSEDPAVEEEMAAKGSSEGLALGTEDQWTHQDRSEEGELGDVQSALLTPMGGLSWGPQHRGPRRSAEDRPGAQAALLTLPLQCKKSTIK